MAEDDLIQPKPNDETPKRRKQRKILISRRANSGMVPLPSVMDDGKKPKPIKMNQCLVSPLTLYEIAANIGDNLDYPEPFKWTEEQVADWMEHVVGLPQYRECIMNNYINGRRLLRLEISSDLPEINIRDFDHIKKITTEIRKLFATDYILFARSIGLPVRKPGTHCTWFKSRTGPAWGIRENWTRSDILRWMKILKPKPLNLDHWDLLWYMKPDFPCNLFARIPKAELPEDQTKLPNYVTTVDYCNEYLTPRQFRLRQDLPEEAQLIWMEHLPGSPSRKEPEKKEAEEKKKMGMKKKVPKMSRLLPKKISPVGLLGKDLILARRKMPKPKFLP